MGYSVGDKVEVKPQNRARVMVNGVLTPITWTVWLLEIASPRRNDPYTVRWRAKFTRASHPVVFEEGWIVKKISSNFEGFYPIRSKK